MFEPEAIRDRPGEECYISAMATRHRQGLKREGDVQKNRTPEPSHSTRQLSTAMKAAAFVAEYRARPGAGMVAATEDRWCRTGDLEVEDRIGSYHRHQHHSSRGGNTYETSESQDGPDVVYFPTCPSFSCDFIQSVLGRLALCSRSATTCASKCPLLQWV